MSRTYRKGWTARTGSKTVTNWKTGAEKPHQATNDWYSKKSTCRGATNDAWDEYWGRDKRGVKQTTRRMERRALNRNIDGLYGD